MIDWNKSAELNDMTEDKLRARFVRYPQSNKKVVAVCDGCGKERNIEYVQYRDMCHKCSHGTSEAIEANRLRAILQFSDVRAREIASETKKLYYSNNPNARKEQSVRMRQYHEDHPDAGREHSKRLIEYFKDNPEVRNKMSEVSKKYHHDHPDAYTAADEMKRGGHDIVGHHMIYDHNDLSKNIMYMTRSVHSKLHALFRKHGIDIPHINVNII